MPCDRSRLTSEISIVDLANVEIEKLLVVYRYLMGSVADATTYINYMLFYYCHYKSTS